MRIKKLTEKMLISLSEYIARHYVPEADELASEAGICGATPSSSAPRKKKKSQTDDSIQYSKEGTGISGKPLSDEDYAFLGDAKNWHIPPEAFEDKDMREETVSHSYSFNAFPSLGGFREEKASRPGTPSSLDKLIREVDLGFSKTLLQLIDEKGMTDSECYKKANVDRRLFSKIRSDSDYHPKKTTALAFCVALSLSAKEAESLLDKAGYSLSYSSVTDVIVRYFLDNRQWDIDLVNQALYEYDQPLLSS